MFSLAQVQTIYAQQIQHLRDCMRRYVAGQLPAGRVRACYPYVRIQVDSTAHKPAPENLGLGRRQRQRH